MRASRRVLVLMDTDSYVKWGATIVADLPPGWEVRLAVLRGHTEPSDRQVVDALRGTDFTVDDVARLTLAGLRHALAHWAPDVLLLATRAHAVPAVARLVAGPRRPVLVTGVAGIALPVQWYDVGLRRPADVFVVHSHRERRDVAAAAARAGVEHRVALATMPFLRHAARRLVGAHGPGTHAAREDGPVVFAPQALVPSSSADRALLARRLVEAARARPDRRLVVKLRTRPGEVEAHRGRSDLPALVRAADPPDNLVLGHGSMAEHLDGAAGLVTISSSATLEAVAAGVPALVLTDFGVDDSLMNAVFVGSGLLGSTADLAAGRLRRVDPGWARDNYFHDAEDDTWVRAVDRLLLERDLAGLDPCTPVPTTPGGRVRAAYYRHDALAPWRGTALEGLERRGLAAARRLNRTALHLR